MPEKKEDRVELSAFTGVIVHLEAIETLQFFDGLVVQLALGDQIVLATFRVRILSHKSVQLFQTGAAQNRRLQIQLGELLAHELKLDTLRKCQEDALADDLLHGQHADCVFNDFLVGLVHCGAGDGWSR